MIIQLQSLAQQPGYRERARHLMDRIEDRVGSPETLSLERRQVELMATWNRLCERIYSWERPE